MKTWRILFISALCAAAVASAWAGQQQSATPAPAAAPAATAANPADTKAVHDRAKAFYAALIKGDRVSARKMVDPDSENQFEQIDLRSLDLATIDAVSLAPEGDNAVVSVTRHFTAPYSITIAWKDQWKKVNGEWLFTIPQAAIADNPFGIKANPNAQPPSEEEMKRQAEFAQKTVDTDQVYKQVEKLQRAEFEKQKAAIAARAQEQTEQEQAQASKTKEKKKPSKKDSKKVKENSLAPPATAPNQQ